MINYLFKLFNFIIYACGALPNGLGPGLVLILKRKLGREAGGAFPTAICARCPDAVMNPVADGGLPPFIGPPNHLPGPIISPFDARTGVWGIIPSVLRVNYPHPVCMM